MERPTCVCCNELKAPSRTRTYRGGRQLARAHSQKTHLGAHHVCLLRRSHRQYQKALFVRGPFVGRDTFGCRVQSRYVEEPFARKLWALLTYFRTCSCELELELIQSHLLVPFRLHCALLTTKVCVGGGLTRMRLPPPLSVCNNFAAIPLPAPIDEMKPTWAELSVTALAQAACRYEVNDRERKKARSRSLVFKSESPAANCLPRPCRTASTSSFLPS